MTKFISAEIYKTENNIKYTTCLFKNKKQGWSIQWVRSSKLGDHNE